VIDSLKAGHDEHPSVIYWDDLSLMKIIFYWWNAFCPTPM